MMGPTIRLRHCFSVEEIPLPQGGSLYLLDDLFENPDEIEAWLRGRPRFFNPQGNPQVRAELDASPFIAFLREFLREEFVHGAQNYYAHTSEDQSRLYVHADEFDWMALSYFARPPGPTPGISFFRHRRSGAYACPAKADRIFEHLSQPGKKYWHWAAEEGYSPEAWERVHTLEYRFNRCIVFPPRLYHRAELAWGTSMEDCRLVQSIGIVTQNPWTVRLK